MNDSKFTVSKFGNYYIISNNNFHAYVKFYLVENFIILQKKVILVMSSFTFFLAQNTCACGVF